MLMSNPVYKTLFYAIPENFGSMWPGKWPETALRQRHREIGTIEFNRGFRNEAVDTESQVIPSAWIRFDDLTKDQAFMAEVEKMQFICSYDTAGTPTGKTKDPDYCAGTILAVDVAASMVYVVDSWHARLSTKGMELAVVKDIKRYRPFKVVIEKTALSSLHEWIVEHHPELYGMIETATPKIDKGLRLLAVTPLIEAGRVVFSEHLNPNTRVWNPGRGSLVHELEDFPFAKHDDMVDSFSQGLWWARRYFLDSCATRGDNGMVDIRVGTGDTGEISPYLY
jgi:predicted phage terminase large subunit-like protein